MLANLKSLLPLILTAASATTFPAHAQFHSSAAETAVDQIVVDCHVDSQDDATYHGTIVEISHPEQVQPHQLFEVNLKLRNTGTATWFSARSNCPGSNPIFLGTTKNLDRHSLFFAPIVFGSTNWQQPNRIHMSTNRVDPGEIATFTFQAKAPQQPGIYREYYQPVAEGLTWFTNPQSQVKIDLTVGNPIIDPDQLKITGAIEHSLNLTDPQLAGEKKIVVDVSEQKMLLMLDDFILRQFPVSTGTYRTPTPFGTTKITSKQDVRVGYAWPHYIMPKFMMFRSGGYGIHALPSLANDNGVFWTEALNHIGTRRSHGCIRLLPDDANFAYDFADIGTTVQVIP